MPDPSQLPVRFGSQPGSHGGSASPLLRCFLAEQATGRREARPPDYDEIAVLATAVFAQLSARWEESRFDGAVLEAFQRSSPALVDADIDEVAEYAGSMSEAQLHGVSNNVKGILHEQLFVGRENADDDLVRAELFADTNHPDFDVQLIGADGVVELLQLKATNDAAYVQDWLATHPGDQIAVTSELARALDLPDSGFSNHLLTAQVDDFLDRLEALPADSSFWDHLPALSAVSIATALWHLWKRHTTGRITHQQFVNQAALLCGVRVGKLLFLAALLHIPVINVIVGCLLGLRMVGLVQEWLLGQQRRPLGPRG